MSKSGRNTIRERLSISLSHVNKAGAYIHQAMTMFEDAIIDPDIFLSDQQRASYIQHKADLDDMIGFLTMFYNMLEDYYKKF